MALRRTGNGVVVAATLVVALPAVALAERCRTGSGRRIAHRAIRWLMWAGGIRVVTAGIEGLPDTCVVVANHTSPVDIPALLVARADLRFVAAAELFDVPLLGSAIRALGSVPVVRRRDAHLPELAGAGPVVVFAEGGIPEPGILPRFETGAFVLAIRAAVPVVPVTIHGSAAVLPRGARIWARPGLIRVEYHEPIPTSGLTLADRKALRDRTERVVRG